MQSHSYQSYASPGVKTLIAEEVKKLLTSPLVKSCALVLITMLLMVTIALSLGIWWDGLWSEGYNFPRGTQKPLVPGIVVVAPMLDLAEGAAKLGGLGAPMPRFISGGLLANMERTERN